MSKTSDTEEQGEQPVPAKKTGSKKTPSKKKTTSKKVTSKKTGSKKTTSKKTQAKKGPAPQRKPAEKIENPTEELGAPPVEQPDIFAPRDLPTKPVEDVPAYDYKSDAVLDQPGVQPSEGGGETEQEPAEPTPAPAEDQLVQPAQPPSRRELSRRRRGDRRRKTPAREQR